MAGFSEEDPKVEELAEESDSDDEVNEGQEKKEDPAVTAEEVNTVFNPLLACFYRFFFIRKKVLPVVRRKPERPLLS
jgi:hypothetical protein